MSNNELNQQTKKLMVYQYLDDLRNLDINLILLFFSVFSRFEFTLKASGTYCDNDRYGNAKANWVLFAQDVENKFNPDKSPELRQAFDYYVNQPPKIQIFDGKELKWRPNVKPADKSDFAWLVFSIKVVRNNLFHGGKFPYDQQRDSELLNYGLIILNECIELDEELLRIFRSSPVLG